MVAECSIVNHTESTPVNRVLGASCLVEGTSWHLWICVLSWQILCLPITLIIEPQYLPVLFLATRSFIISFDHFYLYPVALYFCTLIRSLVFFSFVSLETVAILTSNWHFISLYIEKHTHRHTHARTRTHTLGRNGDSTRCLLLPPPPRISALRYCFVSGQEMDCGRQSLTSHALLCLTFPVVKPFTLICKIKRKSSSVIFEIQVLKTRYGCYWVFRYFIKKKSQLPVFKAVKCSVVDQRAK